MRSQREIHQPGLDADFLQHSADVTSGGFLTVKRCENGDRGHGYGYPVFGSVTDLNPRVALGTESSIGKRSADEPPT